jgi:hypothetical protein
MQYLARYIMRKSPGLLEAYSIFVDIWDGGTPPRLKILSLWRGVRKTMT